jgi:hypothetical protein
MPAYASLNTQIEAIKSEIAASLAASTYSAQDLVYIAKTVETLGNLLGINDLVAASADAQTELNDYLAAVLDGSQPLNVAKMYVGDYAQTFETFAGLQDPAIIASIETQDYAQIAFQNKGSGVNSSTDFIAYADNGVDDSGYIDMGITSQNFSDPQFTITGASDGYIFMEAPRQLTATVVTKELASSIATLTTSVAHGFRLGMPVVVTGVDGVFNGTYTITAVTPLTFSYAKSATAVSPTSVSPTGTAVAGKLGRGNLVLATSGNGSQNKIIFAAGGLDTNSTQMEITPGVKVAINIATNSTSTSTGALTIAGGLGVQGNVNIGGNVNIAGTITFGGSGTTVQADNLAVVDPAIFVAKDNNANLLDFSFVGTYIASGTKYTSLFKSASDGRWRFVSGLTVKPGATVNLTNAVYDVIQVGGLINSGSASVTGDLTVNTNKLIVTASTGAVSTAGTITTPEVLITGAVTQETDATTVAYVQSAIGGVWATKTANYTLANRDAILANSAGGTFTLTLPVAPAVNDRIRIADLAGTWSISPVLLARNGNKIMGLSEDYSLNVRNASVDIIYTGATYGWRFI